MRATDDLPRPTSMTHRANFFKPAGWSSIRLALGSFTAALLTGCATGSLAPVVVIPSTTIPAAAAPPSTPSTPSAPPDSESATAPAPKTVAAAEAAQAPNRAAVAPPAAPQSAPPTAIAATPTGSPPAVTARPLPALAPIPTPVVAPQAALVTVGESLTSPAAPEVGAVPTDLWERIRRGFAMTDLTVDLVKQQERLYTARPEYLERMVERSRKYLFHIVEELELRNMPTELALLPFVESAFNPQAVSIAKAAGIWQFMPATGRHFDLKQNVFRDDRRDVMASTRAALDYLQRLHGMFGDWHLALASYNWGEGSVGRAIARNRSAGLGTRYQDLRMPDETRYYVPRLQALKNIVANPQTFNVDLPAIPNHPYFQDVDIRRDIDVVLAARLADVKLEDFRALNPSANRPIILAAGTGKILLPWDNAEIFKRNLEAHSEGRLASWTAWTVPSTMSAAEAARRTGWVESELRSVNSIPPRMLIKAGSTLVVPRAPHVQTDVPDQLADNGSLSLAPEGGVRRTTIKARKGDTVTLIARRHKVSAENLAEWNKVAINAGFKAGDSVVLFLPARAAASKAQPKPGPQPAQKKAAPQKRNAAPAKKAPEKR